MTAQVLAMAPITSTRLGKVVDNLVFADADQMYEGYVEMQNSLALISLDNITGQDLDQKVTDYPGMPPRFDESRATGQAIVSDPAVVKVVNTLDVGGANATDVVLNLTSAADFPNAGSVLIGTRGQANFETKAYTGKAGNQLTGVTALAFDHGAGESVVLVTVGDRVFPGPFTVGVPATAQTALKNYLSTTSLTIYDGETDGTMDIQAETLGLNGNTSDHTISQFVGAPPFAGATVRNEVALTNGQARERDPDVRARLRRQPQALSSANIDAVVATLFSVNNNGQRVKYVQPVETEDPTLPSIVYIDDGAGTVPTTSTFTGGIVLVDVALGGEKRFNIPMQYVPLVVDDAEDVTRVYAGIVVKLNGVTINQGDAANQYRVHPYRGTLRLGTGLTAGDHLEITSITHYTGLIQVANKYVYGDRDDRVNFPGITAIGVWIKIKAPSVQFIAIQGTLVLDGSRPRADVLTDVQAGMLQYVNNLGISTTTVRNRLLSIGFVAGVKNFVLDLPVTDVIGSDGVLPRTTTGNLTLS